jgi:hypothetical protein
VGSAGLPVAAGGVRLDELAHAFANEAERFPLGALDAESAARRANELATFELRAASTTDADQRRDPQGRWAVLAERDAAFRGSPLGRVLRVHFVEDAAGVEASLAPVARHLACAGLAGLAPPERADLAARLVALGASRLCPLGEMQAPPISWSHDGQGVLLPLARIADCS